MWCAAALLRFVSIRSVHVYYVNVAGFLYQIRMLRVRSPFPVPVPLIAFRFRLRVVSAATSPPCKTLARSYSPFPASLRYTASSTAIPRPRRCCFSPRNGASAADAAGHLARLQRTSMAKLQRILELANFKCTNLHIFVKKVISY